MSKDNESNFGNNFSEWVTETFALMRDGALRIT
jgi:hypothetical protein